MSDAPNFKDTLNLPKTSFKMKANLAQKEPQMLADWDKMGLYHLLREDAADRPRWILHDGPPYANGNIHLGTALNKVLKDIIVKSHQMAGFDAAYVPGWDCHGLPIEHKVDEELGSKKTRMSQADVRRYCRKYATKYLDIQRKEFKRLGVLGLWEDPYQTMKYEYEAVTARELGKMFLDGSVYRSKKPVYWCNSCVTALAEAEVEYDLHTSPSIFVKFPMIDDISDLNPAVAGKPVFAVIWTTTPWTIPANLAIALHPDFDYLAVEVEGEVWILAEGLLNICMNDFGISDYKVLGPVDPKKLEKRRAKHPLYNRESLLVLADYVTLEAGTGLVHTAPGHGGEDFDTGRRYNLEILSPLDDEGYFTDEIELFTGLNVSDPAANQAVIKALDEAGALIHQADIKHDYPHCWRCKKPVIFRATPQWFVNLDESGIRAKALEEIRNCEWWPRWGEDRIYGMIENRPDWCISRQRTWGVPITLFTCAKCGKTHLTEAVKDKIFEIFSKDGADAWFERPIEDFLTEDFTCPDCGAADWTRENDILDVWFDSGTSWAAVLETNLDTLAYPCQMYLEGSDQHRGWFHSSLLCSVANRGQAPYKSVLTHGYVVDKDGRKMSKSLNNNVAPQEVIDKFGAEILRLWVASEDYTVDIKIGDESLARLAEAYRRIRNTCRFLLGNLADFDPQTDAVSREQMWDLDRFALHRLAKLDQRIRQAYERYEFHAIYHSLHNYCTVDLSNLYLDVLKDRLYTLPAKSVGRRSAQTACAVILDSLVKLIAPILSFLAEEVHGRLPEPKAASVHLEQFPAQLEAWLDQDLAARFNRLLTIRTETTAALELARADKLIGNALDARVIWQAPEGEEDFYRHNLAMLIELCLVSQGELGQAEGSAVVRASDKVPGLKVGIRVVEDEKCPRCWMRTGDIGADPAHPQVCGRCAANLAEIEA